MATTTVGKPIDAAYLLAQLKAFDTKVLTEKYNVKFQLSTMPAASADLSNTYVQYVGATTTDYTEGYFYKCVLDADTSEYKWVAVTQSAPNYEIKKLTTPTNGFAATYQLEKDGVKAGDLIDIPKDYFVRDAEVAKVTQADKNSGGKFENDSNFAVGDAYIDLTINVNDQSAESPEVNEVKHLYINVSSLVDTYTAGAGIDITSNEVSVKLETATPGLEFKGTNSDELAIKASKGTQVTADGVEVKAAATGAITVDANGVAVNVGNGLEVTSENKIALILADGLKFDNDNKLTLDIETEDIDFDSLW